MQVLKVRVQKLLVPWTCVGTAEELLQDADEGELEVSVGHCVDHWVERRVEITWKMDLQLLLVFSWT